MVAKKMNMDKLIDLGMNKLFQLAEYVCSKTSVAQVEAEPAAQQLQQDVASTIRFYNADGMVEGELFKGNRGTVL